MVGVDSRDVLLTRLEACDRVIAIAAARGERVPTIVARRKALAVEFGVSLTATRATTGPHIHRRRLQSRPAGIVCEDCGGRWDRPRWWYRDGCHCDEPFVDLGWVGA